MEALVAIGLAGNIVQFLDLTARIVSSGIEVYHAGDGASTINRTLATMTEYLNQLCKGFADLDSAVDNRPTAPNDPQLLVLARSCQELGQELLKTLEDLKIKGKHRKWSSVRQALRSAWKDRDIQRYHRQLSDFRSLITLHLLTRLTYVGY